MVGSMYYCSMVIVDENQLSSAHIIWVRPNSKDKHQKQPPHNNRPKRPLLKASSYLSIGHMFAIWSMLHTTTQHTRSQMVFGSDAILNINQEAIWQRKQALINKLNQKENCCRLSHVYHTGDKVLLKNTK